MEDRGPSYIYLLYTDPNTGEKYPGALGFRKKIDDNFKRDACRHISSTYNLGLEYRTEYERKKIWENCQVFRCDKLKCYEILNLVKEYKRLKPETDEHKSSGINYLMLCLTEQIIEQQIINKRIGLPLKREPYHDEIREVKTMFGDEILRDYIHETRQVYEN